MNLRWKLSICINQTRTCTRGWIRAFSFDVTDKCVSARWSPSWLLARQTYLPASCASTRRICIKSPQSWIRLDDSTAIDCPRIRHSDISVLSCNGHACKIICMMRLDSRWMSIVFHIENRQKFSTSCSFSDKDIEIDRFLSSIINVFQH